MEEFYFFDTYAAIALLDGDEGYQGYKEARAIVIDLNLFELEYALRRRGMKEGEILPILALYSEFVADYGLNTIRSAVDMKLSNRRLSPVDCIGYNVAQEYGVKFLTGDKEFEGLEGVEFVK